LLLKISRPAWLVRGEKKRRGRAWIGTQQAMFTFRIIGKCSRLANWVSSCQVLCIDARSPIWAVLIGNRFSLEKAKEIVLRLPKTKWRILEEELENCGMAGTDLNLSIKTSETNIPRAGLTSAKPAINGSRNEPGDP
jgi:hypothetical protein